MIFWRISNYADLKGIGGIKTTGRWHNKGIPVIYLAETASLAMLETLVHFELDTTEVPDNFQLLEIEYSGRKGIRRLTIDCLPADWQQNEELTHSIGDEWLSSMHGVLLKVPSAIIPNSYNYLFNPRHELAKSAKITNSIAHPYDQRLFTR